MEKILLSVINVKMVAATETRNAIVKQLLELF